MAVSGFHGITNRGHTCYAAVCLHIAASMQNHLPDLFSSLDLISLVRTTRCSSNLPSISLPMDFLSSLNDNPLVENCVLDSFDSLISKHALETYLSFDTFCSTQCLGCSARFSSTSVDKFLYIATPINSSTSLFSLIPLALKDETIVKYNCPCGATRRRSLVEVTHVRNFILIGFKRSLSNFSKNHSVIDSPLTLSILNRSFLLKAVVLHHGLTANDGHYTCLVETATGWLHCNDSLITTVPNIVNFLKKGNRLRGYALALRIRSTRWPQ
jgi:hypothetical protein